MDKLKDLKKKGWHPDKSGGGIRDQVKGFVGRGDKHEDRSSHVAAPLSSLKDPSTFAPPPKRDPNLPIPAPTPYASAAGEHQSTPRPAPAPPARSNTYGKYLTQGEEGTEEAPAAAPSRGWQLDTTGLSTNHLPPPPGRRDGADGRAPSAVTQPAHPAVQPRAPAKGPPPSLPPRLPPRSGTSSPVTPATQTHMEAQGRAENGFLNHGAVSRLGAAGISVPGFGIGGKTSPAPPPRSPASPASVEAPPASQGTTWQQKQAALRTASQFHKDPSSVSLSDARSAASTANNFRQRHGEQVASGVKTANSLGQRFGVTERARIGDSTVAGPGSGAVGQLPQRPGPESSISVSSLASALGKKKPPPPPPKKKPELGSGSAPGNAGTPPPVPLSTRPTF